MKLSAMYGFYGSSNISLTFEQDEYESIRLKTDYGETIAVVKNLSELKSVIDNLVANKYKGEF